MNEVRCTGLTDLFFSFRAEDIADAKAMCATCPSQEACLQRALACRPAYQDAGGVWAGTTPAERRAMRRELLDETGER